MGENNTKLSDDKERYNTYQRNYYREKLSIVINCPKCNREITKQKLKRHQGSHLCVKNQITKHESGSDSECSQKSSNVYREAEEQDTPKIIGWYKED